MTDVEMLEVVLRCQTMHDAISEPRQKETEVAKYLRWASEAIAKRIWWDNRETP